MQAPVMGVIFKHEQWYTITKERRTYKVFACTLVDAIYSTMSLSLVWVLLGLLASASGHVTTGFVGTGVPDILTIVDRYVRIQVLFVVSEKHLLAWFNYKATFMFVH